jgi:hypothetical protein
MLPLILRAVVFQPRWRRRRAAAMVAVAVRGLWADFAQLALPGPAAARAPRAVFIVNVTFIAAMLAVLTRNSAAPLSDGANSVGAARHLPRYGAGTVDRWWGHRPALWWLHEAAALAEIGPARRVDRHRAGQLSMSIG